MLYREVESKIKEHSSQLEQITQNKDFVSKRKVKYVAHRGCGWLAPENSIPAYELAGSLNFWGAECDLLTTSDSKWVLMHDDTVDRTTDGTGNVWEKTLGDIKSLKVDGIVNANEYPNLRVPTLEEYLECCKEFSLTPVLELKRANNDSEYIDLINILKKYNYINSCIIFSSFIDILAKIRNIDKTVKLFLSEYRTTGVIEQCIQNKINGLAMQKDVLTKDFIDLAHSNNLEVMAWTITNYIQLTDLKNKGIDYILSDKVVG